MDGTSAIAIFFFLLLILAGVDSEFGTFEAFVFYVLDMKLVSLKHGFFYGKYLYPYTRFPLVDHLDL
jgi:hypothetical protein